MSPTASPAPTRPVRSRLHRGSVSAAGAQAPVRAVTLGAAPDTQPRRNVTLSPFASPPSAPRFPRRFRLRRSRRARRRWRFPLRRRLRRFRLLAPGAGQHHGRGGSLPPSELTPDAGLGPGLGVRVRAFVAAARVAHAIKTHDDLDRIASRHVWQRACPPLASRPHWIQIAAPRRFSRSFAARSRCAAAQSLHSLRPGRGGHRPHRVQEPSAARAA